MNPILIALGAGILLFGVKALADNKTDSNDSTDITNPEGFVVPPARFISDAEILQYAYASGFRDDDLATAVAVALAESGGNVNAYNPESAAHAPIGKGSFGLWQIFLKAHPGFSQLWDAATNAAAAHRVYLDAGARFTPWSTFKSSAHLQFLDRANTAIANNDPGAIDLGTASTFGV